MVHLVLVVLPGLQLRLPLRPVHQPVLLLRQVQAQVAALQVQPALLQALAPRLQQVLLHQLLRQLLRLQTLT